MTTPTNPLLTEARTALAARLATQAAQLEEARRVLSDAATAALRSVLTYKTADGTTVTRTLAEMGLTRVHRDLDLATQSGVVVWSSGDMHLAAQKRPDAGDWTVRVVTGSGSSWTPVSERIRDLADVGAAVAR